MARTGDPNSATAQFFINVNDNKSLNFREPTPQGYGYTVFGKVVEGMDVVNKIADDADRQRRTVPEDVPVERVIIKQRDRRRRRIGMTMVILHTNHGAITHRARRGARAEERRQLPRVRRAPDTSTTRCSIA